MKLNLDGLHSVQKNIVPAVQEGLQRALDQAKQLAESLAPVETGALAAGFYTTTRERSGYAEAVSAAMSANPAVEIVDEIPQPKEAGIGDISNVVGHAIFQELGSVFTPGQPSLGPASQAAAVSFPAELTRSLQEKAFKS